MAEYYSINNHSKLGKISISRSVFESVAENAANQVAGVQVNKSKRFKLYRPVQVEFRKDGKVDVIISISLKKGVNSTDICAKIEEEVSTQLLALTESVPFRIEIKITEII